MKKFCCSTYIGTGVLAALAIAFTAAAQAAPFTLSNAPGDGTVTVGVDGYGAFGSSVGTDSTNAVYDPTGAAPPAAGTTFESGVAIRFGTSGTRSFLTSGNIFGTGGLSNPTVTGTFLSGSSSFTVNGLSFDLVQTLTPLFTGSSQTGSILTQTYSIRNTTASASYFELVRYIDGDLVFDGSILDGGGRIVSGSNEILFETDTASGTSTATTFVGITATGGTIPVLGRYEVDSFSGLGSRIVAGTALDNTVAGDGGDADQFVESGGGYDVTLALNNTFSLAAGATTTYTTATIFGAGIPEEVVLSVPDGSSSLLLLGLGLGTLGWLRRRM